jgi:hypothetical protein
MHVNLGVILWCTPQYSVEETDGEGAHRDNTWANSVATRSSAPSSQVDRIDIVHIQGGILLQSAYTRLQVLCTGPDAEEALDTVRGGPTGDHLIKCRAADASKCWFLPCSVFEKKKKKLCLSVHDDLSFSSGSRSSSLRSCVSGRGKT